MPYGNKAKIVIPVLHFGATVKPTVRNENKEHNELVNEIDLVSCDNLDQWDSWAFSFRSASDWLTISTMSEGLLLAGAVVRNGIFMKCFTERLLCAQLQSFKC